MNERSSPQPLPEKLSAGNRMAWNGDIDDLLPDLRDFFPKRPPRAPEPPLPYVDEKHLRSRPPKARTNEVFRYSRDISELKRRALARVRQHWSAKMIAEELGVEESTIYRWRKEGAERPAGSNGGA